MAMQVLTNILLDIVVAGLLVTTIVFCWKLNRRILVLQDSKGDMAQLIRQFDEATEKASSSVADLNNASKKLQDDMTVKIQKANFIADDLAFMIEKGNKVAEKMLSSAVQQPGMAGAGKAAGGRLSGAGSAAEAAPAENARPLQPSPRGPRVNTAADVPAAPAGPTSPRPAPGTGNSKAALESVMERLGNKPGAAAGGQRTANIRSRSRSEQELLDALKNDV